MVVGKDLSYRQHGLQKLQVARHIVVEIHHEGEDRWLASIEIVNSTSIRDEPKSSHQVRKIEDYPPRRFKHLANQQTFENPQRVPIVEFSKPSPCYSEWPSRGNGRVTAGVAMRTGH